MEYNKILMTDSYKHSHFLQLPPLSESIYEYIESRGGVHSEIVVFGITAILKKYLSTPITQYEIDEAEEICLAHGEPFNKDGFQYILSQYNGYIPIKIKAIPEGTVVPVKVPVITVECNDDKALFIVGLLEPILLQVWYPITVATNSRSIKKLIKSYLEQTADDISGLNFKLHDFGFRGTSSPESAEMGGMAHLVNFRGTDTMLALTGARRFYSEKMAGFSIPAAEHSTITSWLRENETEAYRNMINRFSKEGSVYAIVSDSYDLENAVDKIFGHELKELIIQSKGVLVVRPDSGNPTEIVLKTVQLLDKNFGSTVNSKKYKVLNHVRVIQGDGINEEAIRSILFTLKLNGYSADNVAFGMGGALLQGVTRDDQRFAMKCSSITVDGVRRDVFKDPITDKGKTSKKGLVTTYLMSDGSYKAGVLGWSDTGVGVLEALETVYELVDNLPVIKNYTLQEIRDRAELK